MTAEASAGRASQYSSVNFRFIDFVYSLLLAIAILGTALALFLPPVDFSPEPQFFARLIEVRGLLDPCIPDVRSPIFYLALDVDDQVSERKRGPCAGGEEAMLRISYHGIVLAWGNVDGRSLRQRRSNSVASVVATAEGFVLLEEIRDMIRAETNVFGRVVFDVDGSIPGLGHLHCKMYLFRGEPAEGQPECSVQRTLERGEDF